ncbi:MAG: hypothetical protein KIT69_21905, partial [Propionibacteriaceae bacterium]|nr:hypothetical protein [Propionibacteriaceae bacterium]
SSWTYDKLGRVASQVVQTAPGPVQVARQDLAYFGNDDPKWLEHWLGTDKKKFVYTFDHRHQITGVSETEYPSAFTATYVYGPEGRFTEAVEAAASLPGSNVKPRDVVYQYGGADPEQVTALVNSSDSSKYAEYEYDAAGNQILRCEGALSGASCSGPLYLFVYDGKDQLRRVTKKVSGVVTGSEEYWYDGFGQRVAVVKRDAAGDKTEMTWFLGDTQVHLDDTGATMHAYVHISMGMPVARFRRTGDTTVSRENQFHGLGNSTLAAIDHATGDVNASFTYSPFGAVVEATDAGAPTDGVTAHKRRFNDKHEDDLAALSYYGARYYDKTLIGWTQV